MSTLVLLVLMLCSSFAVAGGLSATVVAPRLRALPRALALRPLLWVNTLRYVPLALLAPGQTGADVPPEVIQIIAWGDFTSAWFAMAALAALHLRQEAGLGWVWAFFAVSILDIVVALSVGMASAVYAHALGVGWFILTLYVPLICVAQLLMVKTLLRPAPLRPLFDRDATEG